MSEAEAEPCRWHSDTPRKILSKPCVSVGGGVNETCQQMDRSGQNIRLLRKVFHPLFWDLLFPASDAFTSALVIHFTLIYLKSLQYVQCISRSDTHTEN